MQGMSLDPRSLTYPQTLPCTRMRQLAFIALRKYLRLSAVYGEWSGGTGGTAFVNDITPISDTDRIGLI